jgi:hypothetical protein
MRPLAGCRRAIRFLHSPASPQPGRWRGAGRASGGYHGLSTEDERSTSPGRSRHRVWTQTGLDIDARPDRQPRGKRAIGARKKSLTTPVEQHNGWLRPTTEFPAGRRRPPAGRCHPPAGLCRPPAGRRSRHAPADEVGRPRPLQGDPAPPDRPSTRTGSQPPGRTRSAARPPGLQHPPARPTEQIGHSVIFPFSGLITQ